MKSGMEMMLESMGIQVEPIKALLSADKIGQLFAKVERMYTTIDEIYAAVLRVEIKLETIPKERAFVLLSENCEQAQKDVEQYVRDNSDRDSYN